MSLCLASPPVSTDCAALSLFRVRCQAQAHVQSVSLLTVCLYSLCSTNCSIVSGHELVLGILPCLNWLCCTNCSPHCVSVSLSDDHHWTWACAWHLTLFDTDCAGTNCLPTVWTQTVLHMLIIVLLTVCLYHCRLYYCRRPFLDMSLCLASYPVWADCAALIVLLTVCLYHCRTTISGHELVLGISPCLNWLCCTCSPHCVSVSLSDMSIVLGITSWIVLLTVCVYHCRLTILLDTNVILTCALGRPFWTRACAWPCFNWLCCTNCSPHCVSVSLSADHLWTWACAWHLTLFELTVLH